MIELKHIGKVYHAKGGDLEALKDINLSIEEGEIYGIIGLSGAGKSTLIRCVNLLERPTEGSVQVDGQELTALSEKALTRARRQIGMIFQHFTCSPRAPSSATWRSLWSWIIPRRRKLSAA